MRKFLKLIPFLLSCLVVSGLGGCSSSGAEFEIQLKTPSIAYLKKEYNFEKYIVKEDNVNYSISARYYDNTSKAMTDLKIVNDFRFTPLTRSDIVVTVNGERGGVKKQKKATVRVGVQGDPVDELLANGASSYADDGVVKQLNFNTDYIKGDGESSIEVSYYGRNYYQYGCTVIAPNNFRLMEHWSDQEWSNAILSFDVYNPSDYDFYFQIRVKEDPCEEDMPGVDVDWGNPIILQQTAKKKQWSNIKFSMRKLGVTHPLYMSDETYTPMRYDNINVKTWWKGTPGTPSEPDTYTWQMYIDNVDIVPASTYPDFDTTCEASAETYKLGYENIALDTGEKTSWGRSRAVYDRITIRTKEVASKSSMVMTFKNCSYSDYSMKYSVAFNTDEEALKSGTKFVRPDFSHGTISADFKFSNNINDKHVDFVAVNDWETTGAQYIRQINLKDLNDGWFRLSFDMATVAKFSTFKGIIRFGFSFPGVTEANKSTAKINIDNIIFNQNGATGEKPAVDRGEYINQDGGVISLNVQTPISVSSGLIVLDYKIVSSGLDDQIAFMIFDEGSGTSQDWEKYFGYFFFDKNGAKDTYAGIIVTTSPVGDGYLRITITTNQLTIHSEGYDAPTTLNMLYFRNGGWTTAEARIDIISVA